MTSVPRVDEPNLFDEPGMVNTLRVTLVAMLTSALAISALTLFLGWRHTPQLALVSAASCLAALVLSRFGRMRFAMLLPLLSITYAILHLAARSDGMKNIGLAILPVLIMLGGLVLDRLTLVFFTAAEILAITSMLAIRHFVLQAERYSTNDLGDLFIFALTCATAALMGRLLAVRFEDSFRLVRNSESRYRRMFDSIQDVYFEMLTDGTLLELSPAGAGLFGVAREEMIGRPIAPFCANRSEFDGFLEALLQQGRVSNHELVIRNSRAALVHVLVNASLQRGNATGENRLIGSIRDITERRRAEEALRQSEARLRLALDATGAGTFDFYPQSNKLIWSGITKSHFGMSPATEIDHDMFLAAVHPHDRERIRQLGLSVALPGGEGQLATEYRTIGVEDGRERWIAVRGRMLFDEENRATRLIGTTLDITARKRAEEELIASENRYRTLFEAANDAIFLHGVKPDGTPGPFVAVNQVAVQRLGFSAEEFTALTTADIDEEGYAEDRRRAMETMRKEGSVTFEMVHVAKGGRRIPVEISSRQFTTGGSTLVLSIARDITERKRAERELRESEERFRSLSAAALEGIMVHSEGVILDANAQFVRLFGYESAEELIGRNGLEFMVTPESAARLRRRMQECDAGPFEVTGIRKDGSTFPAETDSRPLQHRGHAAIIVSCRDISERKRAEAEQEKLRTQLAQAQKMESIGRLAGGVAHDFNNLLTVINGYSQVTLAKLPPGDPSREPLERILSAGEHAAELTRQLLAFSRKQVLQPCVLDLNRVTAALRPMLERLVGEDIEVRIELSTDSPLVQADPHQLEQVIMNLSVNSRDAMPNGGSLLIETSLVELDAGFAKLHPETHPGRYAMLAVSDTGLGIDETTRQRIFEPFFTTKPVGQGTGLGLSMVQGIVAQSGGYIEVHSEPDRGTTFKIYLPLLAGAGSEEEKPPAAAALRGNETILLVEDHAEVRDYGVAVLKEYGYRVIPAVNAGDALSICERERGRIHMLLADVVMPDTGGPELAARLVKMRPGIKVLFMSGYTDSVVGYQRVLDKDAHFIQKPFTPEELARKVRVVLGPPAPPDRIAVSKQ